MNEKARGGGLDTMKDERVQFRTGVMAKLHAANNQVENFACNWLPGTTTRALRP